MQSLDGSSSAFSLEVFTTRPDTIFGATYMVVAPEHPQLQQMTTDAQQAAVSEYVAAAARKSDLERTELQKGQKTGVFTGAYAINPASQQQIPVYVADYVLGSYGSGAIMAVPAHDERDFEFAKAHDLPVVQVRPCLIVDVVAQFPAIAPKLCLQAHLCVLGLMHGRAEQL